MWLETAEVLGVKAIGKGGEETREDRKGKGAYRLMRMTV